MGSKTQNNFPDMRAANAGDTSDKPSKAAGGTCGLFSGGAVAAAGTQGEAGGPRGANFAVVGARPCPVHGSVPPRANGLLGNCHPGDILGVAAAIGCIIPAGTPGIGALRGHPPHGADALLQPIIRGIGAIAAGAAWDFDLAMDNAACGYIGPGGTGPGGYGGCKGPGGSAPAGRNSMLLGCGGTPLIVAVNWAAAFCAAATVSNSTDVAGPCGGGGPPGVPLAVGKMPLAASIAFCCANTASMEVAGVGAPAGAAGAPASAGSPGAAAGGTSPAGSAPGGGSAISTPPSGSGGWSHPLFLFSTDFRFEGDRLRLSCDEDLDLDLSLRPRSVSRLSRSLLSSR